MIIINSLNTQRFTLDGIQYFKNYISKVVGNRIIIYNVYNSCDVLVELTLFSDLQLDGVVYGNVADLQSALLPIIYTRDSLGGAISTVIDLNRFTFINDFTFAGQNMTINAGWTWLIQGLNYTNTAAVLLNVPLCTTSKTRLDIVYAASDNTFHLLQGIEVNLNPVAPSLPVNTLLATTLLVTDSSILPIRPPKFFGFPTSHLELEGGTERPLFDDYAFMIYGTTKELAHFNGTSWEYFPFGGSGGGIQSFEDVILVNPLSSKGFYIAAGDFTMGFNEADGSINLNDLTTNNRLRITPDEIHARNSVTLIGTKLNKNGIEFKNKEGGERGYLNNKNSLFNQEISYPAGTANFIGTLPFSVNGEFADPITGDIPISFPGTVDEILEFVDLASFPVTGLANFYYLALDTNKTYRWSGSGYVAINEGIALGETSATAYRGDRGKVAYDHTFDADIHVTTTDKAYWNGKADIADIPLIIASPYKSTFTYSTTTFTVPTNVLVQAVLNHNNIGTVVSFTQIGTTVTIVNNCVTDDVIEVIGILNTNGSLPVVPQLELGETSTTAYRGDRGKIAYDHTFDADIHVTTTDKAYWNGKQNALGFTPEDSTNKSTSTGDIASSVKFPVWSAIVSYVTSLGYQTSTQVTNALASFKTANFLDFSSSGQNQINSKQANPTQTTGSVISFTTQKQWNTIASPSTSNITDDLTGSVIMTTQKMYHNSGTAPSFPAGWVKRGTGNYVTGVLNTIYAEWSVGTTVEYWITQ